MALRGNSGSYLGQCSLNGFVNRRSHEGSEQTATEVKCQEFVEGQRNYLFSTEAIHEPPKYGAVALFGDKGPFSLQRVHVALNGSFYHPKLAN